MSSINEIFLQNKLNGGEIASTFNISITTISVVTSTNALSRDNIVRLVSTSDCHIVFGTQASVAATTAGTYLPANTVEYFSVGNATGLAVIRATAEGTLHGSVINPVVDPRVPASGTGYGERG